MASLLSFDPATLMRRAAGVLPAETRQVGRALLDLVDGAHEFANRPPAIIREVCEVVSGDIGARGYDVPTPLLLAVACALTGYDIEFRAAGRGGVMALPGGVPTDVASFVEQDAAALDAVRANVEAAAVRIGERRGEVGLARAVTEYAGGAAAARSIVGALAVLILTDSGVEGFADTDAAKMLRALCA